MTKEWIMLNRSMANKPRGKVEWQRFLPVIGWVNVDTYDLQLALGGYVLYRFRSVK